MDCGSHQLGVPFQDWHKLPSLIYVMISSTVSRPVYNYTSECFTGHVVVCSTDSCHWDYKFTCSLYWANSPYSPLHTHTCSHTLLDWFSIVYTVFLSTVEISWKFSQIIVWVCWENISSHWLTDNHCNLQVRDCAWNWCKLSLPVLILWLHHWLLFSLTISVLILTQQSLFNSTMFYYSCC